MKNFFFLVFFIFILPSALPAEVKISSINKIGDGLYLMYYDSTAEKRLITKSTIVEFKDYIALLEMPIINDGVGTQHLSDHSADGEKVLEFLQNYFPNKPLKYVLSSHWHPHSISSVIPFISRGITFITTKNNFKRIGEFVDSAIFTKYRDHIRFIKTDSATISDSFNSIVIWKFNRTDYRNVPTEDFLYFHLPKYNYLHCSCMYQRYQRSMVRGKEMVSPRTEDLYRFISSKGISPHYLIGTDTYWDEKNEMISADTMRSVLRNGITMSSIENELLASDNQTITTKSDSIIADFMAGAVPTVVINNAVYTSLKKKDLNKALALAKLQALTNPSDPNVWDTLGEVYYFRGDAKLAKKYESVRIDKSFNSGGEKVWEKDLKEYRESWGNN